MNDYFRKKAEKWPHCRPIEEKRAHTLMGHNKL